MFFIASSFVSPSDIQPGNEGTITVNPPSSLGSRYILMKMGTPFTFTDFVLNYRSPWRKAYRMALV